MTTPRSRIVLLGAGGQALETVALCADLWIEVAACLDESAHVGSRRELGLPTYTFADAPAELRTLDAVCAVGSPMLRRRWSEAWTPAGWRSLVHPTAHIDSSAVLGEGTAVAMLASLGPGALVGPHALVNVGASVAHETTVGEFVTVGPGARIAGRCQIGAGAFIGIGAVVSDKLRIGEGAVVGAGAVVVEDVEPLTVVAGNPARLLRRGEDWS